MPRDLVCGFSRRADVYIYIYILGLKYTTRRDKVCYSTEIVGNNNQPIGCEDC